jgi:hypothetical protein
MPLRRIPLPAIAATCAVLAACGGEAAAPQQCRTPAPATPPSVAAGPLTARADRGVFPAGGTLRISLDAAGPVTYNAPCDQPVQVVVVDSADLHVAALSAPAPKGTPCGAVTLAAGQTAHYEVPWTADETLPPGTYRLVVTLGDQASLALPVELGVGSLGCA